MLNLYRIYYFNLMKGEGMEKTRITRPLALILAIIMSFGSFQGIVFADDNHQGHKLEQKPSGNVRVIVETDEEPLLETASKQGKSVDELSEAETLRRTELIKKQEKDVKNLAKRKGIDISSSDFDYSYVAGMSGFSAVIDASDLDTLAKIKGVKDIHIQSEYERPRLERNMVYSKSLIGIVSDNNEEFPYDGKGSVVAVLDTGVDPYHKDFKDFDDSDVSLTKDKVNALIEENNMKGEYISSKVPYAYDYHDNKVNPKDEKSGDQHGMHVAGTIAANGDTSKNGIRGVAPGAQILAMKVFSNSEGMDSVYTDMVLQAIEDSIILGADAINLSLGARSGFTGGGFDSAQQSVYQRALENGIICAIAVGNDRNINDEIGGLNHKSNPDQSLVGTPSTLPMSLAVSSFNNSYFRNRPLLDEAGKEIYTTIHSSSPEDKMPEDDEYVYVGLAKSDEDFKDKDLEGKIALAKRGDNSFTEKRNLAEKHGAKAIVIFNHEDGGNLLMNMLIDGPYNIPAIFIGHDDGMALVKKQENGKLSLAKEEDFYKNPEAGKMAFTSSWGPTSDLRMKPEIMAPGDQIYSLQNDDRYMTMSGTSMATPHVAGGIAVVKNYLRDTGNFGFEGLGAKERADLTRLILMNTSVPQGHEKASFSVMQQGSGLMNLANAIETKVIVRATNAVDKEADGKLELKDNVNGIFDGVLEFENISDEEVSFEITAEVLKEGINDEGFLTEVSEKVNSAISGDTNITVPAKGKAKASIKVNFDGIEDKQFVNGFINLNSETNTDLSVPFLGFVGDWNGPRILDGVKSLGQDSNYGFAKFVRTNNDGNQFENPVINHEGEKKVVFGKSGGIMPIFTPLRNAESLNFKIEDKSGNLVADRLTAIGVGKNTFDNWWNFSQWWGETRNEEKYGKNETEFNYVMTAQLNYPGAEPQVYSYPIILDTESPKIRVTNYNEYTRELTVEAIDNLTGVPGAWIYSPNSPEGSKYLNFELKYSEVTGKYWGSVVLPKAYFEDNNLWLCTEDEIWNFAEIPLANLKDLSEGIALEEEDKKDEGNKDDGGNEDTPDDKTTPEDPIDKEIDESKLAYVRFLSPEFLSRNKSKEIEFEALITDYADVKEIKIQEIDPYAEKGKNAQVVGENKVLQEFVLGPDNFTIAKDGSINVKQNMTVSKEGLIDIRLVVNDNGKEKIASHKFYVDENAPALDDVSAKVEGDKATINFNLSDNLDYLELQEYLLIDTKDEEGNPDGGFYDRRLGVVGSKERWEHIITEPIKAEFSQEVPLEHAGDNVFYYAVWDKVDNGMTFKVVINKETGEVSYEVGKFEDIFVSGLKPRPEEEKPSTPEDDHNKPGKNPDTDQPHPIYPGPIKPNPSPSVEAPATDEAEDKDKSDDDKTKAPETKIVELSGPNRIETAVEISKSAFDKADTVVIAQADGFADALAAGPLAAILDGPILLAGKTIDQSTLKEIERLGAKKVLIVGGENSVSADVLKILKDKGLDVQRIAGDNRYETALEILGVLDKEGVNKEEIILASGKNFADSLSIAPYAGINKYGILLVGDKLDTKMEARIKDAGRVLIVGGENSVAKAIEERVAALGKDVKRIAGNNRYETSAKIARDLFDNPKKLVIASGENYPDALTGTIKAIKEKAPILLTGKDSIDPSIEKEIKSIEAEEIFVLGGESTISKTVREKLK